ncbi:hypothetical protein DQ04_00951110, partial [Trypanosoma grayi]|uniref:hypothetical protein n=1 Tax=Trypanosoma grayi TaxID=71804 RepID=UPI0004F43AE0
MGSRNECQQSHGVGTLGKVFVGDEKHGSSCICGLPVRILPLLCCLLYNVQNKAELTAMLEVTVDVARNLYFFLFRIWAATTAEVICGLKRWVDVNQKNTLDAHCWLRMRHDDCWASLADGAPLMGGEQHRKRREKVAGAMLEVTVDVARNLYFFLFRIWAATTAEVISGLKRLMEVNLKKHWMAIARCVSDMTTVGHHWLMVHHSWEASSTEKGEKRLLGMVGDSLLCLMVFEVVRSDAVKRDNEQVCEALVWQGQCIVVSCSRCLLVCGVAGIQCSIYGCLGGS